MGRSRTECTHHLPGQRQRISLGMSNVTIGTSGCCSAQVSIWKPDGSNLVYPTLVGTTGGFLDTRVLPVSGMYTILVDPAEHEPRLDDVDAL